MRNRTYFWIAAGAVVGALAALVIPGLDAGFGIAIGVAVGIAISLERPSGRRRPRARRPRDEGSDRSAQ